jgi:hypothetical protein
MRRGMSERMVPIKWTSSGIVFFSPHQHADPPHAVGLLRPRRQWPRRHRAGMPNH